MSLIDRGAMTRRWMMAGTFAALMVAPPLSAQTPRASAARVRCVNCDSVELAVKPARERQRVLAVKLDSLRDELMHKRLSDAQREALLAEMTLALRALQDALGERAAYSSSSSESARRALTETRMLRAAPVASGFRYTIEENCTQGYLGVSFDGVNSDECRGDERIIRFYQYPRIALVEPASPAERAGIRLGDTLIALNDIDVVSGEISLTKILVPDKRLNVLVKRDGDNRLLPVTVGRAPEYVVARLAPTPLPPGEYRGAMIVESQPSRRRTSVNVRGGVGFVFANGIGGARVEPISEGLGRALGVSSGVLVMSAPVGSPAHKAGLRDGDVIRRAAGEPVTTVRELREILAKSAGDGVRIQIRRERRNRELTLRW
jgi:C-terminal processing protease CtpA/Prc